MAKKIIKLEKNEPASDFSESKDTSEDVFISGMRANAPIEEIKEKMTKAKKQPAQKQPDKVVEPAQMPARLIYVHVHPFGSAGRAYQDFKEGKVKQRGNVLMPDGTEGRPGATYQVERTPEIQEMIRQSILLAGF